MTNRQIEHTYLQRAFQSFVTLLSVYTREKILAAMACKCVLKGLQFSICAKSYLHTSLAGTFRKSKATAISVSCS